MKGRYQLPTFAKFNRPDPMRDWDWLRPHTLNLYEYCGNDPINKSDPTGLLAGPVPVVCTVNPVTGVATAGLGLTYLTFKSGLGKWLGNKLYDVTHDTGGGLEPLYLQSDGSWAQTRPDEQVDTEPDTRIDGDVRPKGDTDDDPDDRNERIVFFRGTTVLDAVESVGNNSFDLERIQTHQAAAGHPPDRQGVFLTQQLSTAEYYATEQGIQGRGLGPAVVRVEVPARAFLGLAARYGIALETPVPQPPRPGQTETLIPMAAAPEFNQMADLYLQEAARSSNQ